MMKAGRLQYTKIEASHILSTLTYIIVIVVTNLSLSKDIDIINTHGKFEIEFPSMESILKSSNEVNLKVNSRCIYLADLPVHHSAEGSHNAVSERCDLMPDSLKLWSIERSQNGNDSPYTKS